MVTTLIINIFFCFQVTSYISSVSELYVHDGAISSLLKCDAKVRIVSDSPSSVLSLSKLLWRTPSRAVSHDTCPLTVYVASSIRYHRKSQSIWCSALSLSTWKYLSCLVVLV